MKQGWEIKKLGEVCKIQTGKLDANAKVDNGEYPFFTCDSKPYKIDKYAFDDEAILISGNGSLVGHVNYYKGKFNAYQRTYVLTKFNSFHLPFLICFLKRYLRPYIVENKKGGCIPYITLPILQNFSIPCPPLPEQEKIVAELDCLSGIIEKKKQQLKELDALAQSIFYEMFGDPVTNEKGWEVKRLGDISVIGTGATPSRLKEGLYYGGDIPWVKTTEVQNCEIINTEESITQQAIEETNCKVYPSGTLLMAMYGQGKTRGQIAKLKIDAATNQACAAIILNKDMSDMDFVYELLLINYENIRAMAQGGNQANLNLKLVSSIPIILPPLPLQQTFASKIEAIEKQKELIKQSINEVETLFNSRMQEYFG